MRPALQPRRTIGRHGFRREAVDGLLHRHRLLLLRTEPAHRDGPFDRLALADDEQHRHFGERMFAHLVGDLLVAQIAFDAQPAFAGERDQFTRIIVGLLGDRRDDDLQRREP